MSTLPVKIVVTVVEPPARPFALELLGARRAEPRCGEWPICGTLDAYLDAVDRARRELHRLVMLQQRYWRRFGVVIDDNPLVAAKWRGRHEVARELFERRLGVMRLLKQPEVGSA